MTDLWHALWLIGIGAGIGWLLASLMRRAERRGDG
jgi:hypothetical protein